MESARELFLTFDGSRFYMDRDGELARYRCFDVPPEVEAGWLSELTEQRLAQLDRPGNWSVVHFLWHHGDCRHLSRLVEAEPRGVLWERTAYLEELLLYVTRCEEERLHAGEIRAGIERVRSEAVRLRAACRSAATRARVDALIAKAQRSLVSRSSS